MYRSQRKIVEKLGLQIAEGTGAGETALAIIKELKKGIPDNPGLVKLLERTGYLTVKRVKWGKTSKKHAGSPINPQSRVKAGKARAGTGKGLLIDSGKAGKGLPRLAIASLAKDPLRLLVKSQMHGIIRALKKSGLALVRYHKSEGRITVAKPHTYIGLRGRRESKETIIWRKYVAKLKHKYGKATPALFSAIIRLAKKANVSFTTMDSKGNPLSTPSTNLMCHVAITKALKSNNKLRKMIGAKPL